MKWILECGLRLVDLLLKIQTPAADPALAKARADFAGRYREVWNACSILEPACAVAPARLAGRYMNLVLSSEDDSAWWQENGAQAVQPWFVWDYACTHGLVTPTEKEQTPPPPHVLRPSSPKYDCCAKLRLERLPTHSDRGRLEILLPDAPGPIHQLLLGQRFLRTENGYTREITEHSASIADRAVENAVLLLEDGCSVCVDEPELARRVLDCDYTPEHLHWVLAAPQQDMLQLLYPHDPRLHQYVYMAGGRWNGQIVLISITNADKVEELMRLYGFRTTAEARRRLNLWHEAIDQAVIYRQRGGKTRRLDAPVDVFKSLLGQQREVIEDLLESDE